jgi:hypothetical protein
MEAGGSCGGCPEGLNPSLDVVSGHDEQQAMLMYDQSAQNKKDANKGESWAELGGVVQPGICADVESHRGEEGKTNAPRHPMVTLLKRRPRPK